MRVRTRPEVHRLLVRSLPARFVAGPRVDDALRVAGELIATGRRVSLEHAAADPDGDEAELTALLGRLTAAGWAAGCDVVLAVGRLGAARTRSLAAVAADAGVGVVLAGAGEGVGELPGATVVVSTREPDAERRCRALAAGGVRLADGGGSAGRLAFVRCLNVLMAAPGRPGIATTDPRLIAITGERAAWHDRAPESWEHVMPYGVRTDEQQRLVAAGHRVRVAVPSGAGALGVVARRLGGRA
ncbi:proline dehydrogenase [Petropleomorpha daqingensis]|uniref:Proline dehydrogenase n=1 Tax=Petropleomorpha daqingensis TaxID=2026353 RepID=A0A853CB39_9ACTN|nr:proline dehydrogenase [Petropleomorpha daqingensis]NYJ04904.1 proline dehydrogenase [Petropleomorpha daqingensis]